MTQEFLDNQQYTELSILNYEEIFGHNYISPGGEKVADQFIRTLELRPQMRVLDIGCGLGGPAFRMAGKFGVYVHCIDLSLNMIRIAKTRLDKEDLNNMVTLEQGDCLELQIDSTYDVVHSRDVFLHIKDKARLFEVISKSLISGGRLGFSDYCHGKTKSSPEFESYLRERNYTLHNVEDYTKLLENSGFTNVFREDRTDIFIKTLKQELHILEKAILNNQEKSALRQVWQEKLTRAERGEQCWGWFSGIKKTQ